MREAAGDVAGVVEAAHGLWRQVDLEAREVIGELLRGPRADIWIIGGGGRGVQDKL